MIIMINGAFGAGKTTTSSMLQPLIPNSMIYDPEEIGLMIRKVVPEEIRLKEEQTDDFQDIELWRILTVKIALEVRLKYKRHLIVPMTIYKSENFEYIYNGFRDIDKDIKHFCLKASEETIHKRLAIRGDKLDGWSYKQTKKCVEALRSNRFQEHIETDNLATKEIVEIILRKISKNIEGNLEEVTDFT
ncbi:ATP-binding protein [Cohnella pontilimi]|uniref:ATP-binding protein n=1 Tax=Cohnella pontilimi TaxID=2564100 RepID=A0A4V5LT04_9BACL|nr:AAA family ATPase [Cohnella pontilimi]TJY43849.1 ATP-binding protein [Cohnella pontilimi]